MTTSLDQPTPDLGLPEDQSAPSGSGGSNPPQQGLPLPRSVLPEYEVAATKLMWTTLNELMARNDPVLERIQRVAVDDLPVTSSGPVPSVHTSSAGQETGGDLGAYHPLRGNITFQHSAQGMLEVDVDDWAALVFESSKRALDSVMPQIFEALSMVCEATGQTLDARGKPFTADLMLDMLEKLAIDFDESGAPELPTIVVGPELFRTISTMPALTPEQEARFAAIIASKRRDHDAKRRVRRLDKDPSGT